MNMVHEITQKKILMVEDDVFISDVIIQALKREGFNVIYASKGSDVLPLVKEEHPDLILLDLALPDMDGLDVLTDIRKEKVLRLIPVIVYSNNAGAENREMAKMKGAVGFIEKSKYMPSEVVAEVKKILRENE